MACWLLSAAGCVRVPSMFVPGTHGVDGSSLAALLAAHRLLKGENVSALALGRTEACSYHLVQIRDREQPHVHATHDLAVTLLRGNGSLAIQGQVHEMQAGDVAVVPRGTPHYFVNSDSEPAVAFVTFAPPFDGTDQLPVAETP